MRRIEITPSCHAAVRAAAHHPFVDTSVLLPNGNREVWISEDTFARLLDIRFPGETLSDTVERLVVTAERRLN